MTVQSKTRSGRCYQPTDLFSARARYPKQPPGVSKSQGPKAVPLASAKGKGERTLSSDAPGNHYRDLLDNHSSEGLGWVPLALQSMSGIV